MIEVELPDGSIAEFPDGTPNDVIKGALQKRFGAPQQAPAQATPVQSGGFLRTTDDFMRGAADTSSFGFADEISARMGAATGIGGQQGSYEANLATERARDAEGGWTRTAGQVAGALLNPISVGRAVLGKASTLGGAAVRSAIDGAAFGTAYGAGSGTDADSRTSGAITGAALGGVVGGAAPYATAGVSKVAGALSKKAAVPTIAEINAAKSAAYDASEQAGVAFTPQAVDRIRQRVTGELTDMGYDPALQPGAAAVVRRLEDLQGQNVTMKGLDTLRKVASNGYVPGNKSNNMATGRIIEAIDEVVEQPRATDILMGNAQAGSQAIKEARALASRSAKMDWVAQAISSAELRAASTGSGGNVDNAIRQNLRKLLEKPRGFTADEKAALEAVVRGTPTQNALRLAGKLSPQGNGLMAALGVGGAVVNPAIGAISLAGLGAKAGADKMTKTNVQKLADIIASGGNKAVTPNNAVQQALEARRAAIARALIGGTVPAFTGP